uniref:URF 1 n=1 Tax=Saccharomyces cerevisiae TaxID=4932 RepID=E9PA12_YEASX|nr:unnamed protein product [Saccharomyces cerevisiae]
MHKFVHIRAYLFIYLKFLRPFNVYIFNEYLNLYISFFFFFLSLSLFLFLSWRLSYLPLRMYRLHV